MSLKVKNLPVLSVKWKNIDFYVTSVKRITKTGRNIVVYQASNFKAFAKKHVQIYGFRWNIVKFFRTGKQYLGLTHSQLRSKNAQKNHKIFIVSKFLRKLQKHCICKIFYVNFILALIMLNFKGLK